MTLGYQSTRGYPQAVNLAEAKEAWTRAERALAASDNEAFVIAARFPVPDDRVLRVGVSPGVIRAARRARLFKSPALLTAFKNAAYGFDEERAKSAGGSDGVFLLTREFRPANAMQKKIFDRFLDRPGSEAGAIAKKLGVPVAELLAVRVVSHHVRLLGVLVRSEKEDTVVLVDVDATK